MNIKLYADGSCSGNPGPGGYGIILSTILKSGQPYESKYSAGYRLTTNNRMELMGVINGLQRLNGAHDVEVVTDSKYVTEAFNQHWIDNWRNLGWRKSSGSLPNEDLWRALHTLVSLQNSVKFTWVKGHKGHPYNEECDRIAVCATRDMQNHFVDEYYEANLFNII